MRAESRWLRAVVVAAAGLFGSLSEARAATIAHFAFDGGLVFDDVGGRTGTGVFGSEPGVLSGALSTAPTANPVTVAYDAGLQLSNAVSIAFWARRTHTNTLDIVLERGGSWVPDGSTTNYGIGLHNNANQNAFYFYYADGYQGVQGVTDTEWHHYAVVATAGAESPDFYIDGLHQGASTFFGVQDFQNNTVSTPVAFGVSNDNLTIGAEVAQFGLLPSTLGLDDLWIFDHALTAAEIRALPGVSALVGSGGDGVPEPGTVALALVGGTAAWVRSRRRRGRSGAC